VLATPAVYVVLGITAGASMRMDVDSPVVGSPLNEFGNNSMDNTDPDVAAELQTTVI
jgi:hypothetical protein